MTTADRAWLSLLGRLNHQSVTRHFDAYADIDWDSPELALDPEDPRESILKRGLLEFASTLPNGAPEFRYAYHEIIEEALSFARHYLKRTVPGLPGYRRVRLAVGAARGQVLHSAGGHRRGVHPEPAPPGRHRRLAGQGQEAVRRTGADPGPYRVLWRRLGLDGAGV